MTYTILKKRSKFAWGFKFDTDNQHYVEAAMERMHYHSSQYFLCEEKDLPLENESIFQEVLLVTAGSLVLSMSLPIDLDLDNFRDEG